jgi:hypothetical protein
MCAFATRFPRGKLLSVKYTLPRIGIVLIFTKHYSILP